MEKKTQLMNRGKIKNMVKSRKDILYWELNTRKITCRITLPYSDHQNILMLPK